MKNKIGEMAAKVWKTLGEKGCRNFKTSSNPERERGDCLSGFRLAGPRRQNKLPQQGKENICIAEL